MNRALRLGALLSLAVASLSLTSFATADSDLHFPTKIVPAPMPPAPIPPETVTQVKPGEWYIIGSKQEYVWQSEPSGVVEVKSKPSGITICGKFADGSASDEERTFRDAFVYHVKPIAGKSGKVTLFAFPKGKPVNGPDDVVKQVLTVGDPEPPVPPTPPTPPTPVATGAWVIAIASDTAPTVAQGQVLDGATLRALKAAGKCRVYGSVVDADQIAAKHYDTLLQDSKLVAPALIVLDKSGNKVLAVTLPADEASLAATLKGVIAP
jgi:hypothetical protein